MIGFELLLGHLVGDYIVQNDWMASNKTAPFAGPRPGRFVSDEGGGHYEEAGPLMEAEWWLAKSTERRGNLACFVHCICYTLAIAALCWSWFPLWGYAVVFAAHYPIDRYRLAVWWMKNVSGQTVFATGPLSPWSIIIVDNVFHLLTLWLVARIHWRF